MSDNTITFEVFGAEEMARFFSDLPDDVYEAMYRKMNTISVEIWHRVVFDKLSGQVLNRISGKLSRSVTVALQRGPEEIVSTISAGGPEVPYARIHEYGGGFLPERSYLRSTLQEMKAYILAELEAEFFRNVTKYINKYFSGLGK